jgi:hypothetical protein
MELEFQMYRLAQIETTDAEKEAAFATLFQNVQDGNHPLTGLNEYSSAYSSKDRTGYLSSEIRIMSSAPITCIGTSVHTVPTIVFMV